MKHFILRCAVVIALVPATSWAQDDAETAFANRDFATAKTLWQSEAAQGSADAMLGLGLLADRGFGQERDFDTAYDWYMQAASLGHAEAQFNVAIMLDAGIGRARDTQEAQIWYTRAALRDHARAQYNLGLLFEAGDGVAPNLALAAYWFDQAAQTVPAAAQKDLTLAFSSSNLTSPKLLFSEVGRSQVELVWNADPTSHSTHLVEVINAPSLDENYDVPEISVMTDASGLLDESGLATDDAAWRVVNIASDDTDYVAGDWSSSRGIDPPKGRITLVYDPTIEPMKAAVNIFAVELRQAGYWIRLTDEIPVNAENFYVSYGYASDQELAQSVAEFLPSIGQITPAKQLLRTMQPGEVVVNLGAFR